MRNTVAAIYRNGVVAAARFAIELLLPEPIYGIGAVLPPLVAAYDRLMNASDAAAWAATALFPSAAAVGFVLRRFVSGAFAVRLRPHFVLGYAVFGLALAHAGFAMGAMHALSLTDLWLAILALSGLGLQALLGASLQAPGAYRTVLRRWHLATTWSVALFIAGHVILTI